MPKLTDTQLVILTAAAGRDDGVALPLPKSLKLNRTAATKVLASLLKRDLFAECPATAPETVWRQPENGPGVTLAITAAGRAAIGVEDAEAPSKPPQRSKRRQGKGQVRSRRRPASVEGPRTRTGTKQELLIKMLSRKSGASIADIVEATSWQPHTVRGAISGALKKKLGLAITSEATKGRGRVYRIAAAS